MNSIQLLKMLKPLLEKLEKQESALAEIKTLLVQNKTPKGTDNSNTPRNRNPHRNQCKARSPTPESRNSSDTSTAMSVNQMVTTPDPAI